jgi:hypothetical protein
MAYPLHHQQVGERDGTDWARPDGPRVDCSLRHMWEGLTSTLSVRLLPSWLSCFTELSVYLGIDLPPVAPDHRMHLPLRRGLGSSWDAVELLSAGGTFLTAVAAVASVSGIILDETARPSSALLTGCGWAIGATMQIIAGIIARVRVNASSIS